MKKLIEFSPNTDADADLAFQSEPNIAHIGRMLILNEGIHYDPAVAEYLRAHEEDVRHRTEILEGAQPFDTNGHKPADTPMEIWDLPSTFGAEVFRDANYHGSK